MTALQLALGVLVIALIASVVAVFSLRKQTRLSSDALGSCNGEEHGANSGHVPLPELCQQFISRLQGATTKLNECHAARTRLEDQLKLYETTLVAQDQEQESLQARVDASRRAFYLLERDIHLFLAEKDLKDDFRLFRMYNEEL